MTEQLNYKKKLLAVGVLTVLGLWTTCCSGNDTTEAKATLADTNGGDTDSEVPDSEIDDNTVKVRRDEYGVAHISANTDEDAFYGLGWATASDRLMQMNINVRRMQGRLAEIKGDDQLSDDIEAKLLGWWRHATAVAQKLPAADRALLQAYSDGVNAYLAQHPDAVSKFSSQLGVAPEQWSPAHCLTAWYAMAWLFTPKPFDEATTYYIFKNLEASVGTEEAITQTLATAPQGDPSASVIAQADVPSDVQQAMADFAANNGYGAQASFLSNYGHDSPKFSHAWAVSGDRTTTRRAALVSDPQTKVTAPAIWYEFQISSPSFNARGMGTAGSPGLFVGFNQDIAWGFAAAGADQFDLFRLKMLSADEYEYDGATMTLDSGVEQVVVENASSVDVSWQSSRFGPVITDLVATQNGDVWAVQGPPFNHQDSDTISAVFGMMRASNITELRSHLDGWAAPSLYVIAADSTWDIFYSILGDIPLRSPDSPLGGNMGQEGDSSQNNWVTLLPGDIKPWVMNPASGYVYSGNHRPVGDWYPLPLGLGSHSLGHSFRSKRVLERLEQLPATFAPNTLLSEVQADCVHPARRDLVSLAQHVLDNEPDRLSADAKSFLAATIAWRASGGSMTVDTPGAIVPFHLSLKFRSDNVADELIGVYGGAENGLVFFLEDMMSNLASDPTYSPTDAVVDYLNDQLGAAALNAGISGEPPREAESLLAAYQNKATVTLRPFAGSLTGLGEPLGDDFLTVLLSCPDEGTILSQRAQSYTHYVDFDPDLQGQSLLPPGAPENVTTPSVTKTVDAWKRGQLHPAYLGVLPDDKTISTEVLRID